MKRMYVCLAVVLVLLGACAGRPRMVPQRGGEGGKVVCILYDNSDFKAAVVTKLMAFLYDRGYEVVTDSRDEAKRYDPAKYGAVVYMAEYWAWHVPWHAKRYYRRFDEPGNVVFFVTSGDPDVEIIEPFDAVTSPSKPSRIDTVVAEILARLDVILR